MSLIKSVIKSNGLRSKLLLKKVNEILVNKIKNKKICFLGVTFKANTDDMRDSSSLSMIPYLIKKEIFYLTRYLSLFCLRYYALQLN